MFLLLHCASEKAILPDDIIFKGEDLGKEFVEQGQKCNFIVIKLPLSILTMFQTSALESNPALLLLPSGFVLSSL